jgi:ADP-ribose pyrophosphatase YjhB (NUDIX family)
MKLNQEEENKLIYLLKKVSFPMSKNLFYAWSENLTTVAIEVALLRKNGEIFLTYRDDKYFKGWHIPGSIMIPGDTVNDVLSRVMKNEINMPFSTPTFFNWFERTKGVNTQRGQNLALVFIVVAEGNIEENGVRKFFPTNNPPKDLILSPIPILEKLNEHSSNL